MKAFVAIFAIAFSLIGVSLAHGTSRVDACAGLIGSNGAVNLGRTTTLAAYHDGIEHYVTSFEFQGGGGEFGSLIPLPGIPTNVERGGAWTLQRLQIETAPVVLAAAESGGEDSTEERAEELLTVRIDALDLTVLRGGGADIAVWADEHGFRLSPDAPEVLDFYSQRSPIFLAAVFDGDAAAERGQAIGDGTPIHLTIPLDNPWVPLRILTLGKQADDFVEADVYLLTDERPTVLPGEREGFNLTHSDPASEQLLDDLRSDEGMEWVPASAWLTKYVISTEAGGLDYDLAVDTSGESPSPVAAGFALAASGRDNGDDESRLWIILPALAVVALLVAGGLLWQQRRDPR
ncbi:MAG: DUF2330 domain-containing protein [Dehalococcoidia bacterium]